ncbi:MAG: DUF962 domain-containing protein [Bdellovibrio sp.]|jgi:uncharacterized membrane protein YGL010W
MRSLESYLTEYTESHQNRLNVKIHHVCVPAIVWSLLALTSTVEVGPGLSLGHALTFMALVYYAFFENVRVVLAMTALILVMFATFPWIPQLGYVSSAVFIFAWLGQFYGHKIEGKKPSFLKDFLFLLIGPIWLLVQFFPQLMHKSEPPDTTHVS